MSASEYYRYISSIRFTAPGDAEKDGIDKKTKKKLLMHIEKVQQLKRKR